VYRPRLSAAPSTAFTRFPVAVATVGIVNADSPEQLNEMLMSTPLFLYSEFEVRPLTDYDKYMENVAAALEKRES
jgi:muconolactone delta-isomerase